MLIFRIPFKTSIRFEGLKATRKAENKFLYGPELATILAKDTDSYVGRTLPQEFYKSPQHLVSEKKKILADFDCLSYRFLRYFHSLPPTEEGTIPPHLPPFKTRIGEKDLVFKAISGGAWGYFYKLTVDGKPFGFKVYYDKQELPFSGPHGASALGVFTTKKNVSDIALFYMANPKAGWMLYEYIPDDVDITRRTGPTCEQVGIIFGDDDSSLNRIGKVRVDLDCGFLKSDSQNCNSPVNLHETMYRILQKFGYKIPDNVHQISSVADYETMMETNSFAAGIALLFVGQNIVEPKDRFTIFSKALQFQSLRDCIDQYAANFLPSEYLKQFFDVLMKITVTRSLAAKLYEHLLFKEVSELDRLDALKQLQSNDECIPWRIAKGELNLVPKLINMKYPGLKIEFIK